LNDSELINVIEQEEANCIGSTSGDLSEQRRKALQYYYGQKYGNEVEGRSQVVTTEVMDAVEGILPTLMSIFTSSDEIVRFEPQNPDDEEVARQATDYINYIFSRANNGFLVLYCLFKDALLQKNGFCKVYWEEYDEQVKETYQGLTDDQFTMLVQGDEVEVLAHTAVPGVDGLLHDVVIREKRKSGKICLDPVPPEEVLVSKDTPNDLKKARFVEHRVKMSLSRLREMGFKVDDDIQDDSSQAEFNVERQQRNSYDSSIVANQDNGGLDPATKEVWVCEAYPLVDYDGDGIAERRRVIKVGKKILSNEEFDGIPLITGSPIMMPHKLYGLSIFDLVSSIQEIKSSVTRNMLDNFYFLNNARYEVLDGMVNMDDMLTNRPGGVIRTKVLGAVRRQDTPAIGSQAFQMLEYLDHVKDQRIGVSPTAMAANPDMLNAKAHTAELATNAAQQRTELIARILAETGVKDLFMKILELTSKHQDKAKVVRLRGKWVTVDPRDWKDRFDTTVTVGLGTGSQALTLQSAMGVMQIQSGMVQMGLGDKVVTPQNSYEAAMLYAKAAFPKYYQQLFTDPSTVQQQPQQPNPDMLKIQLAQQKMQTAAQQKQQKMAMDYDLEMKRLAAEAGKSEQEYMRTLAMTQLKAAHEARMTEQNQMHDRVQNERDRQIEVAIAAHTRAGDSASRTGSPTP
jgi:hypothetical protein